LPVRIKGRRQAEARLLVGSAYEDRDLVFATGTDTPLEPGNLLRAWARIADGTGVPGSISMTCGMPTRP
jgi:hypothetical protein